ncbi:MAG: hypothetical protein WAO58_06905 [Fimbriimonadaceae bacterium]
MEKFGYFLIAFLPLVLMVSILAIPAVGSAYQVLLAIAPLAMLNILGGWVVLFHFQAQKRAE